MVRDIYGRINMELAEVQKKIFELIVEGFKKGKEDGRK